MNVLSSLLGFADDSGDDSSSDSEMLLSPSNPYTNSYTLNTTTTTTNPTTNTLNTFTPINTTTATSNSTNATLNTSTAFSSNPAITVSDSNTPASHFNNTFARSSVPVPPARPVPVFFPLPPSASPAALSAPSKNIFSAPARAARPLAKPAVMLYGSSSLAANRLQRRRRIQQKQL
ncbi:MAG: hypothetical protein SGCHY_002961, partial [Lobulomycetales sp.]